MKKCLMILMIGTLMGILPITALGAIIEYEATGTFTNSAFASQVAVGDSFVCRLAYNDGIVDTDSRTDTAKFNNALRLLEFRLGPNASGSYAGGSLVSPSGIEVVKAANVHWFYAPLAQGLGTIGGNAVSLQFYLLDYSHSSPITDLGSGQTLGSVLGGVIDLGDFQDSQLTLSAGKSSAVATIDTLNIVTPLTVSFVGNGQVRIAWPTTANGYFLEMTDNPASPSWMTVTNNSAVVGDQFVVLLDATAEQAFYRLRKPR
jgi:hypothetical protein